MVVSSLGFLGSLDPPSCRAFLSVDGCYRDVGGEYVVDSVRAGGLAVA
jgi:hypothetical protein